MPLASVGYGNFIRIAVVDGINTIIYRFQNYFVQEQKDFQGQTYDWLPFQVTEAENSTEGDNTGASIVLPNNTLALQVVNGNQGLRGQQVTINSAFINPSTGAILNGGLTTNLYNVDGCFIREDIIQLELQSVVNTLLDTFPRTKITELNCGKLPQNSQIRFV